VFASVLKFGILFLKNKHKQSDRISLCGNLKIKVSAFLLQWTGCEFYPLESAVSFVGLGWVELVPVEAGASELHTCTNTPLCCVWFICVIYGALYKLNFVIKLCYL
jgi:hypothetical protein